MPVITNIADLKRIYARKTPKMFYDYAESGSWTEQTFRENVTDFAEIRLRQKVAVDMTDRSTRSTMIGQEVVIPVALAPVSPTGASATGAPTPCPIMVERAARSLMTTATWCRGRIAAGLVTSPAEGDSVQLRAAA